MIYLNPTFRELMELAHHRQLRLVVKDDENFALGDASVHLHADLYSRLTQGETRNYPLDKAYYVEYVGGEPKVVHAYGPGVYQKATNLPPKVEEQLQDLLNLMAEHRPAAPSFGTYAPF